MRHRVYGKKLKRNRDERSALFNNLVRSLFLEEKIQTTQAKAKAIKGLVDKIINLAKSSKSRRLLNQFAIGTQALEKLVTEIVPRAKGKDSGYTSIIRVGRRYGDGAMLVQMSLVIGGKLSQVEKVSQGKKTSGTRDTSKLRGTSQRRTKKGE